MKRYCDSRKWVPSSKTIDETGAGRALVDGADILHGHSFLPSVGPVPAPFLPAPAESMSRLKGKIEAAEYKAGRSGERLRRRLTPQPLHQIRRKETVGGLYAHFDLICVHRIPRRRPDPTIDIALIQPKVR
jgi:hypothetical protein